MNKPFTTAGKKLVGRLDAAGIDATIDRWSEGVDHHPKSGALMRDLSAIDWIFFNDYFRWKFGGDGGNGEILMYMLDVLFDLYDKEEE